MKKPDINEMRDLHTPAIERLIDELLEQYRMLKALETDGLPPYLQNGGYERHIRSIKNTLKKAGCKL